MIDDDQKEINNRNVSKLKTLLKTLFTKYYVSHLWLTTFEVNFNVNPFRIFRYKRFHINVENKFCVIFLKVICDNYQCFDTSYYFRSVFLIHVDRNVTAITIDSYYITANKNKHKLIPRTLKIMNRVGVHKRFI